MFGAVQVLHILALESEPVVGFGTLVAFDVEVYDVAGNERVDAVGIFFLPAAGGVLDDLVLREVVVEDQVEGHVHVVLSVRIFMDVAAGEAQQHVENQRYQ